MRNKLNNQHFRQNANTSTFSHKVLLKCAFKVSPEKSKPTPGLSYANDEVKKVKVTLLRVSSFVVNKSKKEKNVR